MFRPAILRSLSTRLGIAVVATDCAPEKLSGPQASLSTPSAALIAPVATTPGASAVSDEFGPHGTRFLAPVTIQQDMSLTTIAGKLSSAPSIQGGYTPQGLGDIVDGLLARVAQGDDNHRDRPGRTASPWDVKLHRQALLGLHPDRSLRL